MPKKMKQKGQPSVHEELEGFDIRINELGQMQTSFNIDSLNSFLDEKVEDKKLSERNENEEE